MKEAAIMFFISGDVTIQSKLPLEETASIVARTLEIPRFVKDESGRWEESEVYLSKCFGLEFMFCHVKDGETKDGFIEYGLSINSSVDEVYYDGTEKEVDATKYAVLLLNRSKELVVSPG